jgi:hypothetical protein
MELMPTEQEYRKLAAEADRAARRKGLSQEQREHRLQKRAAFGLWPGGLQDWLLSRPSNNSTSLRLIWIWPRGSGAYAKRSGSTF